MVPEMVAPRLPQVAPVSVEAGHATADLTLSFEVDSLLLTPGFQLGAVLLRAVSNTVCLQLATADRPQQPWLSKISFAIDSVGLTADSALQSLTLKPLTDLTQAVVPSPKMEVNAVQLVAGAGAGPIHVSPSSQTATAVQMSANFVVTGIDFTPQFEVAAVHLALRSPTVKLKLANLLSNVAPKNFPPEFDLQFVELTPEHGFSRVELTPHAR